MNLNNRAQGQKRRNDSSQSDGWGNAVGQNGEWGNATSRGGGWNNSSGWSNATSRSGGWGNLPGRNDGWGNAGCRDDRNENCELDIESQSCLWWERPVRNKIKSLLVPGIDYHVVEDMERLNDGTLVYDKEVWMEKKIEAAKATVEDMKQEIEHRRNESDNDSDDSDEIEENMWKGYDDTKKDMYPEKKVEAFVNALPYNVIFDSGFLVPANDLGDEKHCYCPCSKYMVRSVVIVNFTFIIAIRLLILLSCLIDCMA